MTYKASREFDNLINGTLSIQEIDQNVLRRIEEKLEAVKREMSSQRTAKLWLQYMEMCDILWMFIKSECTGNWQLHLKALSEMLPYFVASGHNLYAKSVYLYL